MMKYIILVSVLLILLVLPVNGFNLTLDKNLTYTSFINTTYNNIDLSNSWSNHRIQDKYLSKIGDIMCSSKPYLPLLYKGIFGFNEVSENLEWDKYVVENSNKNFNDSVNYFRRYGTRYGCNETLIYGDMNTGKIISLELGEYGYVYPGIIPKQNNIIVIHTHPDPVPGLGWIYNPIFSYGDKAAFSDDYKAGIRWEGVITSNNIIITNIKPSDGINLSNGYTSGFNFIDQFTQQKDFEKDGMHIQTYKWL